MTYALFDINGTKQSEIDCFHIDCDAQAETIGRLILGDQFLCAERIGGAV